MAMDYATLIASKVTSGSIKRWMRYDDIDSEQIVEDAIQWINARLRVPAMRKLWTSTITSATSTLAFPTDFLEERWFGHVQQASGRIRGNYDYGLENARSYIEATGVLNSGTPYRYSLGGQPLTAYFDCLADQDYAVRLIYIGRLTLSATVGETTNWLTVNDPRVVRAACVAMASEFMRKDSDRDHWFGVAEKEIGLINARHEMQLKALDHDVGGG